MFAVGYEIGGLLSSNVCARTDASLHVILSFNLVLSQIRKEHILMANETKERLSLLYNRSYKLLHGIASISYDKPIKLYIKAR